MTRVVRGAVVALLGAAALLVGAKSSVAQDLELHPGYIDGIVELGSDIQITSGTVTASAYNPATQTYMNGSASLQVQPGGNTATYHLTVESGASGLTYSLSANLYTYPAGGGYIQLNLPGAQVPVSAATTATHDFSFPGYHLGLVDVTIDVTGAATLNYANVSINSTDPDTGISSYANWNGVAASGAASLSAGPGSAQAYATAVLTVNGASASYPLGYQSFTLASGGTAAIAYSIHVDPFDPGSISGTIAVNGAEMDYFYVYAYGGSPSQSLYAFVSGSSGTFTFDPANPGTWTVYAYGYDNFAAGDGYRYYSFPSRSVTVAAGQDVTNADLVQDAAFVGGTMSVGDWRDPYTSYVQLYGYADNGASAGFVKYHFDGTPMTDFDYELLVSAGTPWHIYGAYAYNYYSTANSFSQNYVYAQVPNSGNVGTLQAGAVADLDVATLGYRASTVTIRLTVAGGGTLSDPSLDGYGTAYGPHGEYLYTSYVYANTSTGGPVQNGVLTLTLAPGTYTFNAYAYVQGSRVSFGQLLNFEVLSGDDIEQDLNAPTLTITAPAPLAEFECHESVTVSGSAVDPSGVASVTVNGHAVTLDANGGFSTTVSGLPTGDSTIEITATDLQGNAVTIRRTVTVHECSTHDGDPPVITVPANVTVEATGAAGATVSFDAPTATDAVDGALAVTTSAASGSVFALGSTTVTCSATDAAGNTATATFVVNVVDTTPPVITVPATLTVEATDASGAAAAFAPTATDLVDGPVTVACSPASGSVFGFGSTTVTCSATDAHGNTATASFSVNVVDTTAPTVTPSQSATCLWPPNNKMVPVTIGGTVSDASGARAIAGFTISCNEKDDAKGDGKTVGDCNGKDGFTAPAAFSNSISVDANGRFSFTVNLRAERQGMGTDRTYTIRFTVIDGAGNQTPVSVTVCVPHNQ